MRWILFLLILALLSLGLFRAEPTRASDDMTQSFSFEDDMEGWTPNAIDLELGDGVINWWIRRSQERAKDGITSLEFGLDNRNDNGKIWVERPFAVEPNQLYQVTVWYAFASRDNGQANLFDIITGVLTKRPQTRYDLYPAYKDPTGNGSDQEVGYKWMTRAYEFTVRSDNEGVLYVVVGIGGNWEIGRIYYFDRVNVTFAKKPAGSEFYSFESDMEGWSANGIDLELGTSFIDWSITPSLEFWEDGTKSVKFDLNNVNGRGKIWIERRFFVDPRQKYKVRIDYSLSTRFQAWPYFRIITGVLRKPPETADDLATAYQDKADVKLFALWLHKTYELKVKSKQSDVLYVVVGIWGTEPLHRTYWIDNLCITLTRK